MFFRCTYTVFVTKYRRKVFAKKHIQHMQEIFRHVCERFEATLIEMDGESDHIHLLIHYPPKVAVSSLVNSLKGVSSRLLHKQHREIHQYYWKGVLWSPSYFASSCGGAPIALIKEYIQAQNSPD